MIWLESLIDSFKQLTLGPPPSCHRMLTVEELTFEVFSSLQGADLARVSGVSRTFHRIASDEHLWKRRFYEELVFFGEDDWKRESGDPQSVPSICYKAVFNEVMTFTRSMPKDWERQRMWFQPKEILEPSLTSPTSITRRKMEEVFATKSKAILAVGPTRVTELVEDAPVQRPCYLYMVPDAEGLSGGDTPLAVEVETGMLLQRLRTGKRIFSDQPKSYVSCKDIIAQCRCQVAIGCFSEVQGVFSFKVTTVVDKDNDVPRHLQKAKVLRFFGDT